MTLRFFHFCLSQKSKLTQADSKPPLIGWKAAARDIWPISNFHFWLCHLTNPCRNLFLFVRNLNLYVYFHQFCILTIKKSIKIASKPISENTKFSKNCVCFEISLFGFVAFLNCFYFANFLSLKLHQNHTTLSCLPTKKLRHMRNGLVEKSVLFVKPVP
jgi:hypothetical protein